MDKSFKTFGFDSGCSTSTNTRGCPRVAVIRNQANNRYLMKLSNNFSLQEMFKSATADRLGIDNTTEDSVVISNLKRLVTNVWQPVRYQFGPVVVTSGYRSLELNRKLKSKDSSQHVKGEAIDGEAIYADNYKVACWIRDNLEFDQLILEYYTPGDPSSGWVHCSYSKDSNRNETLTISRDGVFSGLVK